MDSVATGWGGRAGVCHDLLGARNCPVQRCRSAKERNLNWMPTQACLT